MPDDRARWWVNTGKLYEFLGPALRDRFLDYESTWLSRTINAFNREKNNITHRSELLKRRNRGERKNSNVLERDRRRRRETNRASVSTKCTTVFRATWHPEQSRINGLISLFGRQTTRYAGTSILMKQRRGSSRTIKRVETFTTNSPRPGSALETSAGDLFPGWSLADESPKYGGRKIDGMKNFEESPVNFQFVP